MNSKKKCKPLARLSETDGLSIVFVLIIIAIVLVAVYASLSISPYREKGHMYALKEDLRNAHKAARACLAADPQSMIVSEAQLKSKGWSRSDNNLFVSADMTLQKGRIVLKSEYFAGQPAYTSGIGSVSFDGSIVLPLKR